MSNEVIHFSNQELDTIGEIMNISMGSAATAISTMLDRPVNITTPQIRQDKLSNVNCSELEPAIMVKIKYVEGVDGTNIIILRRRDMQIILNLLMGNEDQGVSDDFEFDEMSMSAACEVMNQMMGASATALSEVLGMPINISTPESVLLDNVQEAYRAFGEQGIDSEIVAISFEMDISKILNTTFTSFWPLDMAKKIVTNVMHDINGHPAPAASVSAPEPAPQEPVAAPAEPMASQPADMGQQMADMQQPMGQMPQQDMMMQQQMTGMQQPMGQMPQQDMMMQQQMAGMQQPMGQMSQQDMMMQQQMAGMQQPMGQMSQDMQQGAYPYPPQPNMMNMPGYGQQTPWQMPYAPMYGPNGYPIYPQQPMPDQSVNVKKADFPAFNPAVGAGKGFGDSNLNLLMNIPLEVSVVIGKTKRKIRDIMDLGQGSVVELDKQTGAPAEIIVNGQLLAYGDVVVIDDNFGVRVTEIVGAEELLQSLTGKA